MRALLVISHMLGTPLGPFMSLLMVKRTRKWHIVTLIRSYIICLRKYVYMGGSVAVTQFAWEYCAKLIFLIFLKPGTWGHMISRSKSKVKQITFPRKRKGRSWTRGTPWTDCDGFSPLCGLVDWNFPVWWFLTGHSLLVSQTPRLHSVPLHLLECPTKGLCATMILCLPFWKKCFHWEI